MAISRTRAKARVLNVPSSIEEAAQLELTIAALLAKIEQAEQAADIKKKAIDAEAAGEINGLRAQIFTAGRELHQYAMQHWDELTDKGKLKVVNFLSAGTVRQFETPAAIVFNKKNEEKILEWLRSQKRGEYIRWTPTVNKKKLGENLEFAKTIPGVSVRRQAKFVIKPNARTDRLECTIRTGKWKIVESKSEDVGNENDLAA